MSCRSGTLGLVSFCLLLIDHGASVADGIPQDFFNTHCFDCHHADDANGGVRLDDANRRDWSDPETSEFFERVMKVLRDEEMPPEDAGSLSDRERNDAIESLHTALMEHSATGGTALRRLTRTEYEHTVRKVFGIDFETPDGFPSDESVHGFNNMAEGLVISAPLMEAYFQSAIAVADRIVPPPRPPEPSTCTTIAADELVISYSSGAIIDGAMRLAAKTDTMWRSSTWPEKYEVRSAGTYRIRVSASRFAPGSDAWPEFDEPMKLQVRARSLNGKDGEAVTKQRLLAEFDVTDDAPTEFESVVELYPSETPVFYFANAPVDGVKGEQGPLADTLRTMFDNDPRLLAGWLQVEHGRGLRGGVGWDRVKQIRDSDDLDLDAVQRDEKAVKKLVKKMSNNPGLYAETVVYQFFEEGPALQIHEVSIEGPLQVLKTKKQKRAERISRQFLGQRGDQSKEEYVRDFLRRFLTDAFRRPATEGDIDSYTKRVMQHVAEENSLDSGLHLAIRTVLMSPTFLYRGHRPGKLDEFDLAARLSYFLTSGPPDDELFAAAEAGDLDDPAVLEQQTRRLVKSPQSDAFISDFTGQWLGTQRLDEIMPDARLFPEFTPRHREAMVTETEMFFAELLRENLPLEIFIQPDFTFLNPELAETIYGRDDVQGKRQRFARVSLPAGSPHGGLLGQAAIMMATANGVDTEPVTRGVWVLDNILGDPPPPPPEDVPALTPDTRDAENIRELLAAHRADASCATCHRRIDPLGYVLENFDPVGRWRTHYPAQSIDADGEPEIDAGPPINTTGVFPNDIAGSGAVEFNDVNDLKQFVVDNIDDFAECLSQKLLSYATGRPVSYAEKQELRQGVAAVKSRGNGFQDLLVEVVTSKAFGTK